MARRRRHRACVDGQAAGRHPGMSKAQVRHRTASHQVSAALLNAAEAVLDRDGIDGVTVRAVAQEAAVSPMSVYNRFDNKEGLIAALAMRALEQLAEAIDVPEDVEPVERFRQACRSYRDFAARPSRSILVDLRGGQPARRPIVGGGPFRSGGVRHLGRADRRDEKGDARKRFGRGRTDRLERPSWRRHHRTDRQRPDARRLRHV